jgi:hypothetical protein
LYRLHSSPPNGGRLPAPGSPGKDSPLSRRPVLMSFSILLTVLLFLGAGSPRPPLPVGPHLSGPRPKSCVKPAAYPRPLCGFKRPPSGPAPHLFPVNRRAGPLAPSFFSLSPLFLPKKNRGPHHRPPVIPVSLGCWRAGTPTPPPGTPAYMTALKMPRVRTAGHAAAVYYPEQNRSYLCLALSSRRGEGKGWNPGQTRRNKFTRKSLGPWPGPAPHGTWRPGAGPPEGRGRVLRRPGGRNRHQP